MPRSSSAKRDTSSASGLSSRGGARKIGRCHATSSHVTMLTNATVGGGSAARRGGRCGTGKAMGVSCPALTDPRLECARDLWENTLMRLRRLSRKCAVEPDFTATVPRRRWRDLTSSASGFPRPHQRIEVNALHLPLRVSASGPLAEAGPEIHAEGQLAVKRWPRRQGGGTKHRRRLAGLAAGHHFHGLAVALGRSGPELEEMERRFHRRVGDGSRDSSARMRWRLSKMCPCRVRPRLSTSSPLTPTSPRQKSVLIFLPSAPRVRLTPEPLSVSLQFQPIIPSYDK